VYIANRCPQEPLNVFRLDTTQTWQRIHDTAASGSCGQENRQIAIAPGQASTGSYAYWPNLFNKTGYYLIEATVSGLSAQPYAEFAVVLPPPPIVSIKLSPSTINVNGSSTISWTVTNNATACTASGDWSGAKTPSGGSQVLSGLSPAGTYHYNLSCTNTGGTGYLNGIALSVQNPPPAVTNTGGSVSSGGSSSSGYRSEVISAIYNSSRNNGSTDLGTIDIQYSSTTIYVTGVSPVSTCTYSGGGSGTSVQVSFSCGGNAYTTTISFSNGVPTAVTRRQDN